MTRSASLVIALVAVASLALVSAQTFQPQLSNSFTGHFTARFSISPFIFGGALFSNYEAGLGRTDMTIQVLGVYQYSITANKTIYNIATNGMCTPEKLDSDPSPSWWWLSFAKSDGPDSYFKCQKFSAAIPESDLAITICLNSPTSLRYMNMTSQGIKLGTVFSEWENQAPSYSVFELPGACLHHAHSQGLKRVISNTANLISLKETKSQQKKAETDIQTKNLKRIARLYEKSKAGDKQAFRSIMALFMPIPFPPE